MTTERTIHEVIRTKDGASAGFIIAHWDDAANIIHATKSARTPRAALELFRMDFTPRALRAAERYRFAPPLN
jgi:hypothetical protein